MVFPKIVVPQNGWLGMENPIKMDDFGVPLFLETPINLSLFLHVNTKTNRIFAGWVSPIMAILWRQHLGYDGNSSVNVLYFKIHGMQCTYASRSSLVSIQPSLQTLVPKEPQQ